jgi:hypothetical protein
MFIEQTTLLFKFHAEYSRTISIISDKHIYALVTFSGGSFVPKNCTGRGTVPLRLSTTKLLRTGAWR